MSDWQTQAKKAGWLSPEERRWCKEAEKEYDAICKIVNKQDKKIADLERRLAEANARIELKDKGLKECEECGEMFYPFKFKLCDDCKATEKQQPPAEWTEEWKEYHDKNPRLAIPESLREFVKYAQERYAKEGSLAVNNCHCDDSNDANDEVENYVGDSAEILLLYREFISSLSRPASEAKQPQQSERKKKKYCFLHSMARELYENGFCIDCGKIAEKPMTMDEWQSHQKNPRAAQGKEQKQRRRD